MSLNVSCIGTFVQAGQVLSETTRRKLLALGIDPSSVTSESEAKLLIENAQSKRQAVNKTENTNSKTVCTSESELITRAKQLASKIGVTVKENSSIEQILSDLSSKINRTYQGELDTIRNEYNTVKQNQNSMYAMLNMSANVNKVVLGLN